MCVLAYDDVSVNVCFLLAVQGIFVNSIQRDERF